MMISKKRQAIAIGVIAIGAALLFNHDPQPDQSRKPSLEQPERKRAGNPSVRPSSAAAWEPLMDDSLPMETRLNLARGIHADLSSVEIGYLFSLIVRQPPVDGASQWWAVMNEILEQMRKHGAGAEHYANNLTAIIADPTHHFVVRDYSVQQLAQWIAPVGPEISPGEQDLERKKKALQAISNAARDPSLLHTSVPGTALMALTDISDRLPSELMDPIWSGLVGFIDHSLKNSNTALPLRTTVIQVAALRGDPGHLPSIRALAADQHADPSIRLSSIAALGIYADPKDHRFLARMAESDGMFQYAAKSALIRHSIK